VIVLHAFSFLVSLCCAVSVYKSGHWEWVLMWGGILIYFNTIALDAELARYRAFGAYGEPNPCKRITVWVAILLAFSVAGHLAHQYNSEWLQWAKELRLVMR